MLQKKIRTAFRVILIKEKNLLHIYKVLPKARPHNYLKVIRKLYSRHEKEKEPSLNILFILFF